MYWDIIFVQLIVQLNQSLTETYDVLRLENNFRESSIINSLTETYDVLRHKQNNTKEDSNKGLTETYDVFKIYKGFIFGKIIVNEKVFV